MRFIKVVIKYVSPLDPSSHLYLLRTYEGNISTKGHLGFSGKTYFYNNFNEIRFGILTGNEKENSSQIYQICALSIFV